MPKGIIYLIQPYEYIGTNTFKIGRSGNTNLDRCVKGYKSGSRYICIMECEEPIKLERIIKKKFNKKFKLFTGYEYFEGNENIMKEKFIKITNDFEDKYKKSNEKQESENKTNKDNINEEIVEQKDKIIINKDNINEEIVEQKDKIIINKESNNQVLNNKINKNNLNKKYECKICNKFYSSNKSLYNHKTKFHKTINLECKNKCYICDKLYSSKKSLYNHNYKFHKTKIDNISNDKIIENQNIIIEELNNIIFKLVKNNIN